jgi:hypothetical protein
MADSEDAFRSFLRSQDHDLAELHVGPAIGAWIEFYKAQRVDDVAEGMDWLWFQFGTYDWGDGPSFQVDLTRQFILQGETDDDATWQMHLVLHFPPDPALGSGMHTCEEPTDADEFMRQLLGISPTTQVVDRAPDRVELYLENAG